MSKIFLFIGFLFLLIVIQLLFPQFQLFIPILIFVILFVSPKWGLGLLLVFGLWLDSLYTSEFIIPYTISVVLLGLCIEFLRGRFSKQLKVFGIYVVGLSSMLIYIINADLLMLLSWFYLGRILLITIVNIVVYLVFHSIWQKLSR